MEMVESLALVLLEECSLPDPSQFHPWYVRVCVSVQVCVHT